MMAGFAKGTTIDMVFTDEDKASINPIFKVKKTDPLDGKDHYTIYLSQENLNYMDGGFRPFPRLVGSAIDEDGDRDTDFQIIQSGSSRCMRTSFTPGGAYGYCVSAGTSITESEYSSPPQAEIDGITQRYDSFENAFRHAGLFSVFDNHDRKGDPIAYVSFVVENKRDRSVNPL
mgnify:CR=1 FL=1